MQFKNTQVFNFEGAFRGMRNPHESWSNSDSFFGILNFDYSPDNYQEVIDQWIRNECKLDNREIEMYSEEWEDLWEKYSDWIYRNGCLQRDNDCIYTAAIGPRDLELAQRLVHAGDEHAKFMRQIFVSVDIIAPIYWWKEFDTYKIGTTANSTSTMHKLTSEPITPDKFEWDVNFGKYQDSVMDICEMLRQKYLETKDKRYWRALVQILPQAWLQTRTVTMSYTNLRNIYFQRRSHKLIEWNFFCDWVLTLPYSKELITIE